MFGGKITRQSFALKRSAKYVMLPSRCSHFFEGRTNRNAGVHVSRPLMKPIDDYFGHLNKIKVYVYVIILYVT